jgi:hypothetical protein
VDWLGRARGGCRDSSARQEGRRWDEADTKESLEEASLSFGS